MNLVKEQISWEWACQTLGVDIYASDEEIRRAYVRKAKATHPDTQPNAPTDVLKQLTENFILIKEAFDFLATPGNRPTLKPKLEVVPDYIVFKNVDPGEHRIASFEIRYDGKKYPKDLHISYPDTALFWAKITNVTSLTAEEECPLKVDIMAVGQDWGKNYVDYITLRLDEDEVRLRLELQMNPAHLESDTGLGSENMRMLERLVMLRVIDRLWMDHLTDMDHLRQGIGLRAVGQEQPLMVYKREGHASFEALLASIQHDVAHSIYRVGIAKETPKKKEAVMAGKRVGRNDPCPCGSGKKYKHCCGK